MWTLFTILPSELKCSRNESQSRVEKIRGSLAEKYPFSPSLPLKMLLWNKFPISSYFPCQNGKRGTVAISRLVWACSRAGGVIICHVNRVWAPWWAHVKLHKADGYPSNLSWFWAKLARHWLSSEDVLSTWSVLPLTCQPTTFVLNFLWRRPKSFHFFVLFFPES